jgi:hypothetical protein
MLTLTPLPIGLRVLVRSFNTSKMRCNSSDLTSRLVLSAFVALSCAACSVPRYDVPVDSAGQPTVQSIVERIECEIRDMVRDDRGDQDVTSFHRKFLLNHDYNVAVALSLEVNDTGGLAPNLTYLNPLSAATLFTFDANLNISKSRVQNFTENLQFSVRQIYVDWKSGDNAHDCPSADTNLSGALGIKDFVAMASLTEGLDQKKDLSSGGVFGGSIEFVVTRSVTAFGPTWTLVHFRGPGSLGSASRVNTDKVTVAFAPGVNAGKSLKESNPSAQSFLQQLLNSSAASRLDVLDR